MQNIDQPKFDLNLLVVFDALMRERHVRRAGERLGLSQPAVSHALARLRHLIGDPLFVKHARGVRPTPRAEELAASIGPALFALRSAVVSRSDFDPARLVRGLVIGSSDYADLTVMPHLAAQLRRDAPNVDLHLRPVSRETVLRDLRRREIDLAIGPLSAAPNSVDVMPLFSERFVLVARSNHPSLAEPLSPEGFAELPQLLVSPRGDPIGPIDQILRDIGLKRRIAVTASHFLAAPFIIESTDLVAVMPERVAVRMQSVAEITISDLPFHVPRWTVAVATTQGAMDDPFTGWVVGLIRLVTQAFVETSTAL